MASAQDAQQEINAALDLAWELRNSDPVRALELAQNASERASKPEFVNIPYQKGMASSYLLLGLLHSQLANFDLALSYLFSAQSIFEDLNELKRIGETLDGIATVYSRLGAYQEALQYYLRELELVKSIHDKESEASLLSHIGVVEVYWGDSSKALDYLHQALSLYETLGNIEGQAEVLGTACNAYCVIEDYSKARLFGEKSVELYRQIHHTRGEAESLNNLGEVHLATGEMDVAQQYFEKSLELAGKIGLRYEAARVLLHIGGIYLRREDPADAIERFQKGLAAAEEIGGKQLCAQYHQSLAVAYKLATNFENALYHYEMYHTLKEEVFNQAANGRLRNLEMTFQAESSRQELRLYQLKNVALKDEIDERKRVETSLRDANECLRQQITEREQLISDLDSFSHMVAHDLKNPLQVVIFGSQLLMEILHHKIDDDSETILRNILQMGQKMRAIIDELLVLASVRQQEITLQPLDMAMLIEDVKVRLAPLAHEYEAVIIQPETWPTALGHAPWVEEIWANYISNAIKYGGKPPHIELGATLLGNGYIRFWVRDDGMGIRPESRNKLFVPFKRFSAIQATGHGLGLSIVKRIVEKLGGEVLAESEGPGKGSIFSFTLTDAAPFFTTHIGASIQDDPAVLI